MGSVAVKEYKMEQVRREIIDNNICPTLSSSATQLVMGEGSLDARVVFIGEAPGKKEDLAGRPFIGAAGKFLNEMLESIHMSRQDVYITNIVKYRPPNNRDPTVAEKVAFWSSLERELSIINPQLIVTLGRHSLSYFLPDAVMSKVHGETFDYRLRLHDVTLLPLYHPAAALYNGGLRETLKKDFYQIPRILAYASN